MTNLSESSVIQVTNVAPSSTIEQMTTLFNFIGPIDELIIYPRDENQSQSKTCYVKFKDSNSVKVAQHLSNTVFIDRALIVTPVFDDRIPDESTSHSLTSGLNTSNNEGLINQVVTSNNGLQVISTIDPRLSALGLPQYPALPSNTDPNKIEEIRRTVQVSNLDPNVTAEEVLKFFNQIGEIKYLRLNSTDNLPTNLQASKFALVEFTEQSSVASALQSNGSLIGSYAIKVGHSTQAIIKPLSSRNSSTQQKDIEETMRRVRDSQLIDSQPSVIKLDNINILQLSEHSKNMIAAVAASNLNSNNNLKRSRSRSRPRRSLSRERRRRSRSRDSYRRRYDDRYSTSRRSRERSRDRYSARRSRSPRPSRSPSRRSRTPRTDRDLKYDRRYARDSSRERRRERSRSSERRSSHRRKDYRERSRDRESRYSRRSRDSPVHSSSKEKLSSRDLKESDTSRRRIRENDNNHDELNNKGPSTPPLLDIRKSDELRMRSISPEHKRKHSKEKRKRKERKESEDESDSINNEQELMEH